MTIRNHIAAAVTGALLSGLLASAAMAAPTQADDTPTKVADAVQAQPAAVVDDEDSANCSRSRKRLWVEGEGWIVRRVTICR